MSDLIIDRSFGPYRIVAALGKAREGVAIYHAQARVQTLEEMFRETTGGESFD